MFWFSASARARRSSTRASSRACLISRSWYIWMREFKCSVSVFSCCIAGAASIAWSFYSGLLGLIEAEEGVFSANVWSSTMPPCLSISWASLLSRLSGLAGLRPLPKAFGLLTIAYDGYRYDSSSDSSSCSRRSCFNSDYRFFYSSIIFFISSSFCCRFYSWSSISIFLPIQI